MNLTNDFANNKTKRHNLRPAKLYCIQTAHSCENKFCLHYICDFINVKIYEPNDNTYNNRLCIISFEGVKINSYYNHHLDLKG